MSKSSFSSSETASCIGGGCSCGTVLAWIAIGLTLGALSVNYCLESFLDKTINIWFAMLAGIVLGEFTIPLAIICWVLRLCGIHTPFIHAN